MKLNHSVRFASYSSGSYAVDVYFFNKACLLAKLVGISNTDVKRTKMEAIKEILFRSISSSSL